MIIEFSFDARPLDDIDPFYLGCMELKLGEGGWLEL